MSFYGGRLPNFIIGINEVDLQKKLLIVAQELGQKLEIINIYHNTAKNRVYAWYYHDIQSAPMPKNEEGTTKKKVTKKKTRKVTNE